MVFMFGACSPRKMAVREITDIVETGMTALEQDKILEEYREVRLELMELLFDQVNLYSRKSDMDRDRLLDEQDVLTPTRQMHKKCRKWSEFEGLLQ